MSDSDAPRLRQPALTPVRGAQRQGRVFLNPDGSLPGHEFGAVWRLLRQGGGTPWPAWVENPVYPPPPEAPPGQAVVTFLGHASFLIRLPGGPTLLTDPIWSDRCSPFRFAGPKRVRAPGLGFDALPPIDAVLLSHNHYDHCDIPTLKRLQRRFAPRIITGLGNAKLLAKHGMEDVLELDWWQPAPLPNGAWAHYVPARHATARGLGDRGQTLWGGFVIQGREGGRIYFAGDSAWGEHFREIGHRHGPFDLALLPIGAYEPRWFMRAVHVNPEESVRAFGDLRARQALAMHFGTFRLTHEAIDAPERALAEARQAAGLEEAAFRVPGFGESFLVPLQVAEPR
ncbi:MBL fold metallo-hydrolase [Pseudoroseomonas cervicalis]|uniref:MBL fold metallo-hydrolase n=1 Tax=Teichococcus cervicalis TaxID=204525 RepID=UPI00277DC5B2|nr:MBL fold metallo-hydrolase [Pseudoroseomonas cervicalis]MDQ1078894.1 L-ascorbate metabolism protein UlaG (beta-lactamase superfamily) [Pseudoroseomonas cervicalis]